ncbi:hypothetical protein D3C71_1972870 [compost metagenome]
MAGNKKHQAADRSCGKTEKQKRLAFAQLIRINPQRQPDKDLHKAVAAQNDADHAEGIAFAFEVRGEHGHIGIHTDPI